MRRLRGLGRGLHLHFGIEVGNDVLERLDRLLDRGDLHQLPAADRAVAVLQGDDELAPLFLELNQRQAVIRQISHREAPWMSEGQHSGSLLPSTYKDAENFN